MAQLEVTVDWDEASFDAAFDELERECEQIIRGMAVWLFDNILSRTPQFYGRMVASWSFSSGSPVFVDRSELIPEPAVLSTDDTMPTEYDEAAIKRKGDPAAIAIAIAENRGKDLSFKLGEIIWLANGADHGEGPYAALVEAGKVPLRRVNRPGNAVQRTLDIVSARFSEDVTPRAAATFKDTFIGY